MVPKPTPMGLNLPVPWPTRRIRSTRPRSAGAPPACSGMPRCGPQPRGAPRRARANLRVMRKTHALVPTTQHLQGCDQRATGSAGRLGDEWYGMLPTGNLGTVRGTRPVADGYPSSETGLRSVRRQQSRATRNLLTQLLPRSPRYFRISDAPDGAHTERALGEARACAFRGLTLKISAILPRPLGSYP